jgi:hypothetical protein
MTSQARIISNQKNAKRSSGPKTPEGKERSKMNALKHGLRAETILLPTENADEFDDMLAEFMDEWKPPTGTRRQLVRRTVETAWRLNRCVRIEASALCVRAEKTLRAWDRDRDDTIDSDVAKLAIEPREAIKRLKWTREGITRMAGLWLGIQKALAQPGDWYDAREHHERLLNLRGFSGDVALTDLAESSWRLLLCNRSDLAAVDRLVPHEPEIAEQVRDWLSRTAEAALTELAKLWRETPDDGPARAREAELEAYSFNAQDQTIQRYEGRLDRAYRANLTQLITLTRTGIDLVEDDAAIEEEVAAIEAKPEPVAVKKPKRKPSKAVAPNEPKAIEVELPSVQVERDRGGRIWPVEGVPEGPIDVDRV